MSNFIDISKNDDDDEGKNSISEYGEISKNVKFNLKPTIHLMCTWTFAYKQARKGGWETVARDRCRFRRRIEEICEMLTHILESNHRNNVFRLRFQEK